MPSKKKIKERTYLSDEEKKILSSLVQEWCAKTDKKTRDAFVSSEALPKIQQLNLSKYGPDIISKDKAAKELWDKRVQAVYTWFKNNKPFKDWAVFKLERKIPIRRIVAKLYGDRLETIIADNSPGLQKGDKSYPGIYQRALSELQQSLSDDEMELVEQTRKDWQNTGPPIDVRLKAAKKYSFKGISNAHQLLHKEMYVSCVDFAFFPDPDTGVMAVVCHDYVSQLHAKSYGKSFKTFKEWSSAKYSYIVEAVIGYANYVEEQRNADSDPRLPPDPINFEKGPGMLPLLPEPVTGVRGAEVAKQAGEIIRAYFTRHYQLATGSENSKTPWALIGNEPSKFFNPACIPEDFKFQDPSRMGLNVKLLLRHLRNRQEKLGVNAFHFHHIIKSGNLEMATYPEDAQTAIDSGAEVKNWPAEENHNQGKVHIPKAAVRNTPVSSNAGSDQQDDSMQICIDKMDVGDKEDHNTSFIMDAGSKSIAMSDVDFEVDPVPAMSGQKDSEGTFTGAHTSRIKTEMAVASEPIKFLTRSLAALLTAQATGHAMQHPQYPLVQFQPQYWPPNSSVGLIPSGVVPPGPQEQEKYFPQMPPSYAYPYMPQPYVPNWTPHGPIDPALMMPDMNAAKSDPTMIIPNHHPLPSGPPTFSFMQSPYIENKPTAGGPSGGWPIVNTTVAHPTSAVQPTSAFQPTPAIQLTPAIQSPKKTPKKTSPKKGSPSKRKRSTDEAAESPSKTTRTRKASQKKLDSLQ